MPEHECQHGTAALGLPVPFVVLALLQLEERAERVEERIQAIPRLAIRLPLAIALPIPRERPQTRA